MAKKESLKRKIDLKEGAEAKVSRKGQWLSNKAMDIIKLVLGVCLLPFVYGSSVAFLRQLSSIDISLQNYFWAGVSTFLLLHLFFFELSYIYDKGHRLLEFIFNFFQPLVNVAPYLLPVYTLLTFMLYFIFSMFIKDKWLLDLAFFLFGMTISLHLVYSSRSIRSKRGDLLKSNYIFGFSIVYIINLFLLVLLFNIMTNDFSFIRFISTLHSVSKDIFSSIFTQLFVVS